VWTSFPKFLIPNDSEVLPADNLTAPDRI